MSSARPSFHLNAEPAASASETSACACCSLDRAPSSPRAVRHPARGNPCGRWSGLSRDAEGRRSQDTTSRSEPRVPRCRACCASASWLVVGWVVHRSTEATMQGMQREPFVVGIPQPRQTVAGAHANPSQRAVGRLRLVRRRSAQGTQGRRSGHSRVVIPLTVSASLGTGKGTTERAYQGGTNVCPDCDSRLDRPKGGRPRGQTEGQASA